MILRPTLYRIPRPTLIAFILKQMFQMIKKTGFSKDGKHALPQIVLGLLVSNGGYPLAYSIHEGNKHEGHTMLPVVNDFVRKFDLKDFVVVADSGLMNKENIAELERNGYKYNERLSEYN
jgi:transposase